MPTASCRTVLLAIWVHKFGIFRKSPLSVELWFAGMLMLARIWAEHLSFRPWRRATFPGKSRWKPKAKSYKLRWVSRRRLGLSFGDFPPTLISALFPENREQVSMRVHSLRLVGYYTAFSHVDDILYRMVDQLNSFATEVARIAQMVHTSAHYFAFFSPHWSPLDYLGRHWRHTRPTNHCGWCWGRLESQF